MALPLTPVSRLFGFDRGTPIDRYYIETFLGKYQDLIVGDVLEVADPGYTIKFGAEKVRKSLLLSVTDENSAATIVGDLSTGEGIPDEVADCFILTQTLLCIYDVRSAAKNAIKLLKPGGHLLVTVPGITQISRYDMDRWGQYWGFTDLSLKRLFSEVVPQDNIKIEVFGNVKAASSFLYGLAKQEIAEQDLDYQDPDYQLVIGAVVQKPTL